MATTWPGTEQEGAELLRALQANCGCTRWESTGLIREQCRPHRDFVTDQRWIDGLVFMRRKRDCLIAQENRAGPPQEPNG